MNLNKVMQLHSDMKTKERDMLRSIKAIHGEQAVQAVELQYRRS